MPGTATDVFAHAAGATGLPLPRWLLAWLLASVVVLGFVALRLGETGRRAPGPAVPSVGTAAAAARPSRTARAGFVAVRALGLALFVTVFLIAAVGIDDPSSNVAPVAVLVVFYIGTQVASALVGDIYWALNPFDTLARLSPSPGRDDRAPGTDDDGSDGPWWTAPALLGSYVWFVRCWPEQYPPGPRALAVYLAAYTMVVLAGAAVWGRGWIRRGEGFGALFGLLAHLAPVGRDPVTGRWRLRSPLSGLRRLRATQGLVAVAVVYLGGVGFDGLSGTSWWVDVVGARQGWELRLVQTVGLMWSVAVVAAVYLGACRLIAGMAGHDPAPVVLRFGAVLVPIGLVWTFVHELVVFIVDWQNFVALASDPLGRGWDLFGTIANPIVYEPLTPAHVGAIQLVALVTACSAAVTMAHRQAFSDLRPRSAVRATIPLAGMIALAGAGAVGLLL
ncbi:MAG: hypothetical protein ACT4PW_09075 [Acidimicrobiia bacterium]